MLEEAPVIALPTSIPPPPLQKKKKKIKERKKHETAI